MKKKNIKFIEKTNLPTSYGIFKTYAFLENGTKEHLAMVKGKKSELNGCYVRIHSECKTGDVFGSLKCDCGEQLKRTLEFLKAKGKGILLYLDQEGRGIGLANKIRVYHLQEKGFDTYEANEKLGFLPDARKYDCVVEMLKFLGVKRIKLITNNPEKIAQLEENGIKVIERVPITPRQVNGFNRGYFKTKRVKFNHFLKI